MSIAQHSSESIARTTVTLSMQWPLCSTSRTSRSQAAWQRCCIVLLGHRFCSSSRAMPTAAALLMTSHSPSLARSTKLSNSLTSRCVTSGSADSGASTTPALPPSPLSTPDDLNAASPKARDTESTPLRRGTLICPAARGVETWPPAASIRAFSVASAGLWSAVSQMHRSARQRSVRLSPRLATHNRLPRARTQVAVLPLFPASLQMRSSVLANASPSKRMRMSACGRAVGSARKSLMSEPRMLDHSNVEASSAAASPLCPSKTPKKRHAGQPAESASMTPSQPSLMST
mmetsp:Transcript_12792/g.32741  ORF Transcript_12792/g.32741 Transcript_12792/m.32741 type:complete len:289 (+) Transcript_12792:458-1324(+)